MNFFPIFKKELRSYFSSSIAFIIISIFLILSGFFFYTDTIYFNVRNMGGVVSLTQGLWQYFFQDMRYILLLTIPMLTMRLFAEERKMGTIELLFTYPIRDTDILMGKFLASLSLFILLLILTLSYPISLTTIWNSIEAKSLLAGYLGIFLLGTSFISCGTFISSLTENQIVAAISTFGVLILFWFLTWNEAVAGPTLVEMLLRLSLFDRSYNFFRGVIDTKDVVFFILFIIFFLFLTLQSLNSRKWRGLR
jgi:ABC-2 type transport system permease protein